MLTRRSLLGNAAAGALALLTDSCSQRPLHSVPGRLLDASPLGHRLRTRDLPAATVRRRARVVIAGGGIAGLAAAYALGQVGVRDVLILETLEELGGNSSFGSNAVSAYPWGAHYVPLVRADCRPVRELFGTLRIITDEDLLGRPIYDELYLSSDPQERLWMYGRWQEGLIPLLGSSARDRAEFSAFFAEMERLKSAVGSDGRPAFSIPVDQSSTDPQWRELDSLTFTQYLDRKGWTSPRLRWYANYCCRDDYGSTAGAVSAWAGLHYFAARNGIAANADPTTVVTWPEGNGYLARELQRRGEADQACQALVTRVTGHQQGAVVEYFDARASRTVAVEADAVIVCLPRFVAARVVDGLDPQMASAYSYAPWMVANVTVSRMPGGRGEPLAWDNVILDSPLLGYVVATHQGLEQTRNRTVLTYYWPLSELAPAEARSRAIRRTLPEWQGDVLRDLLRVHPELDGHIENIDVRVWGHGMIRPTPGFLWDAERRAVARHRPPVYFAHSDLSGISIFEEAYCRGHEAGRLAAAELTRRAAVLT